MKGIVMYPQWNRYFHLLWISSCTPSASIGITIYSFMITIYDHGDNEFITYNQEISFIIIEAGLKGNLNSLLKIQLHAGWETIP